MGKEADALFEEAYDAYKRAHKLAPSDEFVLCHWAAALHDNAKTKDKEEAETLLHLAK